MDEFVNDKFPGPIPDMISSRKLGNNIPDQELDHMREETGAGQEIDPSTGEFLEYVPHGRNQSEESTGIVEYPKESFMCIESVVFRESWRDYLSRLDAIDSKLAALEAAALERIGRIDTESQRKIDELKTERSTIRNTFRIHYHTKLYFTDSDFKEAVDRFLH